MKRRIVRIGIPVAAVAILVILLLSSRATKPHTVFTSNLPLSSKDELLPSVVPDKPVRSMHYVKIDYPRDPKEEPYKAEFWMEFGTDGRLLRHRKESTENEGVISVWDGGVSKTWVSRTKKFFVSYEPYFGWLVRASEPVNDPRIAAHELNVLQTQKKLAIQSDRDGKEITLTVTPRVPEKELPAWWAGGKSVILVDAATKLWKQRDMYRTDRQEQPWVRWSWLEYDVSFKPSTFALTPPADAQIEDRTTGKGVAQGGLTDAEAAKQVVRQFFQALIAQDYEWAARTCESTAQGLQDWTKRAQIKTFQRLIWLDDPIPQPELGSRVFNVPYTIEVEHHNGTKELIGPKSTNSTRGPQQHRAKTVSPLPNNPNLWMIVGG